jgi:hypothetical protein
MVQGNYGQGWEDLTAHDTYKEAKAEKIDYDKNERNYPHRVITRRVLRSDYEKGNYAEGGRIGQMNNAKYYWKSFNKKQKIDFLVGAGYSKSVANDLSNEDWDSLEIGVHKDLVSVLMAEGGEAGDNLIEYTIPTWAVGYLINDDADGLTDEEIQSVDKLVNNVYKEFGNASFMLGNDDESVFSYSNDIDSSGTEVIKLFILPSKNSDDNYAEGGKVGKLKMGKDDFSFLLKLSDKELSKRLDLIRKQQVINGKQYLDAKKKGNDISKIEESAIRLTNQENAIIQARLRMNKMAEGGEAGYSKKERVIDYYYQNDVFDDYETYGLSEDDLNNEDKIVKAIIKYHGLENPENVDERFETLLGDDDDDYAEGGEVEDWMEEALASLIEETGSTDIEISYVSNDGKEFYATDNDVEYRVFKTEDDAEETAIQQVREDLEENPEYFNQDWLMNYIDGRDFFEEALNEMNQSYVDDIESESDSKYANRLIAELVENGLMDEADAKSDYAQPMADDLKSDYVALLTEDKMNEGNDGLDYFIFNFGEEETYKMVIDNNLIDIDEASKDAVSTDGIGHFLSSYDGETLYLSDDCVAYRIN